MSRSQNESQRKPRQPSTPALLIDAVQLSGTGNSIYLPLNITEQAKRDSKSVVTLSLIDSGAGGNFVDPELVKKNGWKSKPLKQKIRAFNADGTENGVCERYCPLIGIVHGKRMMIQAKIIDLGKPRLIIGYPWLRTYNPDINWKEGTLEWRSKKENRKKEEVIQTLELNYIRPVEINLKQSDSQKIALQHGNTKTEKDPKKVVPPEFHDFLKLFDEKASERFPPKRPWDHKIELKDTFKPISMKPYRISPQEEEALNNFIEENLRKGYIRPSKSPMASPFFFVGKKDGKLRPCQDYRYLNEHTVKNAYPIPLISSILDKIKGSKWFTKLDVRQGYNNVRIREEDRWKGAFKTPKGLFEPTVMFFGMCNSPATFQSMMDHILRNLIDTGKVMVYMDDIFIHAKTKEELCKLT